MNITSVLVYNGTLVCVHSCLIRYCTKKKMWSCRLGV